MLSVPIIQQSSSCRFAQLNHAISCHYLTCNFYKNIGINATDLKDIFTTLVISLGKKVV